jgi:hypothetical protein
MQAQDVEAMVRDLIVHLGLPFKVLSIVESPVGWTVQLSGGVGGSTQFTVADDRPSAMRAAIQRQLDAQP